jgi:pimeloyl-ACP methyl ester carboxylesterase
MHFEVVAIAGAQIEVARASAAPPRVYVLPEVFGGFRGYVPLLEALTLRGLDVAGINPRSCGASKGLLEDISYRTLATDVAAVIEALSMPPVVVVGHAGGNRMARNLATIRPDLVSGVVLIAAGGRVPGKPEARAALDRATHRDISDEERIASWNRMMFGEGNAAPAHLAAWGDRLTSW